MIHNTNCSNFDKLISIVASLGGDYRPFKNSITLPALLDYQAKIKAVNDAEMDAYLVYQNAKGQRVSSLAKMPDIITRSANAVRIIDMPQSKRKEILSVAGKLLGRTHRVKQKNVPDVLGNIPDAPIKRFASSPQDIDSKLIYFDIYILLLRNEGLYNPNEENISLQSILGLYNTIMAKRKAELMAESLHRGTLIARNELLYSTENNIIDRVNDVKAYIKSLYGAKSPQYKTLTSIKFRKL